MSFKGGYQIINLYNIPFTLDKNDNPPSIYNIFYNLDNSDYKMIVLSGLVLNERLYSDRTVIFYPYPETDGEVEYYEGIVVKQWNTSARVVTSIYIQIHKDDTITTKSEKIDYGEMYDTLEGEIQDIIDGTTQLPYVTTQYGLTSTKNRLLQFNSNTYFSMSDNELFLNLIRGGYIAIAPSSTTLNTIYSNRNLKIHCNALEFSGTPTITTPEESPETNALITAGNFDKLLKNYLAQGTGSSSGATNSGFTVSNVFSSGNFIFFSVTTSDPSEEFRKITINDEWTAQSIGEMNCFSLNHISSVPDQFFVDIQNPKIEGNKLTVEVKFQGASGGSDFIVTGCRLYNPYIT